MAGKATTAWFNVAEFQDVYKELFSDELSLQKHALDRIDIWRSRSNNKLSSAIDCTASVVLAKIADSTDGDDKNSVQFMYGMAVLRYVNLIVEKQQEGANWSRPMHVMAEEVGVPQWIVDLRNNVAHNNMPSIAVLRLAADFALGWLKQEYWETQLEGVDDSEYAQRSCDLLNGYIKQREQEANDDEIDMTETLTNIDDFVTKNDCEIFLNVFVSSYLFAKFPSTNMEKDSQLTSCLQFWKPILRLINKARLSSVLFYTLIDKLTNSYDPLIHRMASKIVQDLRYVRAEGAIFTNAHNVNWKIMLDKCVAANNVEVVDIIKAIMPEVPGMTRNTKDKLDALTDLYSGSTIDDSVMTSDVHRLDDLSPINSEISYVISNGSVDWSRYPIGTCPAVNISSTNLELDLNTVTQCCDSATPVDMELSDGAPCKQRTVLTELEGLGNYIKLF
ncbi:unnamed protein product [Owenia fusiformis]|uniref:Uncharacterized protein n=1 Tax=Owenia fusiformis TaxID=6347 RepID=A0A8J1XQV7_OWEFU|nr:unnamed protein product [Owenia fusiformis]